MKKDSIFCLTNSVRQAETIVENLKAQGFSHDDISVLFADKSEDELVHRRSGGILGDALDWLARVGSLTIPGAGTVVAAGPIMFGLSSVALGTTRGGLFGSLLAEGIPRYEAKRYEEKINSGKVLISLQVDDDRQQEIVKDIFFRARSPEIGLLNSRSEFHGIARG